MQTLKLAARPLLFVVVWMVASAHTISELATVGPALRVEAKAPAQAPLRGFAQARSAARRAP